jgi:hypothetical protein
MVFSRPRYFSGKLLTANDLEAEQSYHRDKQRFRNLYTLGYGIVSGLLLETQDNGRSIYVAPGLAIDGYGREICVDSAVELALTGGDDRLLVCIGYAETEAEPTAALRSDSLSADNPVENARIEEGFEVTLTPIPAGKQAAKASIVPSQGEPGTGIPLAILQPKGKRWVIDPSPRRFRVKSAGRRSKRSRDKRK